MVDMPYFMENDSWYYFDAERGKYVITPKAPQKAKDSYERFYKQVDDENN